MKKKDFVEGRRITVPIFGNSNQSKMFVVHIFQNTQVVNDDVSLYDMQGKSLVNAEFNDTGTKIRLYDVVQGVILHSRWIPLKEVVDHGPPEHSI